LTIESRLKTVCSKGEFQSGLKIKLFSKKIMLIQLLSLTDSKISNKKENNTGNDWKVSIIRKRMKLEKGLNNKKLKNLI
jgi:hypothetical protein